MKSSFFKALGLVAASALAGQAGASGFEKTVMFGGKSGGLAGIAIPYIQGADALYFNPAGLAKDKTGQDISLNLSPGINDFQAPLSANNTSAKSKKHTTLPFGLMYAHSVSEKLGVGVGYYASGGAYADFDPFTISGRNGTFSAKSDLAITEFAVGAGYKLSDAWKVGLSYRLTMIKGDFAFVSGHATLPATFNTFLKDVEDVNALGFKFGTQYKMSDKTTLAFTYRSDVPITAKAKATVDQHTPGATTTIVNGKGTEVRTSFPDAYALAIQHQCTDTWSVLGEVNYTTYGRTKNIQLTGDFTNSIQLDWKDQTNIRAAAEYTGMGMPIRFGYGWTSRVSDKQYAKPSLTPPGDAHSVALGSGWNFGEAFTLNAAADYTWINTTGGPSDAATATRTGDYKVTSYALHLGLGYSF